MKKNQCDFEFESLELSTNYKRWILSQFLDVVESAESTIEVGAGIGQFSEVLQGCPDELVLIEPRSEFVERIKRRAIEARVFAGTAKEFSESSEVRFDALFSINVLEHIEDHSQELADWKGLLNDGGTVCLLVPAFQILFSPIDRNMGHYRRYSKQGLRALLEEAGYDVKKCAYFNSFGFFLWALKFKILRGQSVGRCNVLFFDRVLIYLAKFMDWLGLNSLCGQSVVAIATKR